MLTKELLRFHTVSGRVKPQFIDPADRGLLAFAAAVVRTYQDFQGTPRSEILETLEPRINSQRDLKLARGLWKLYDDMCVFSGDTSCDWAAMRRTLFSCSSRLILSISEEETFSDFRTRVFAGAGETVLPLSDNIYADLPDYERLAEVPKMTPALLLEKYNVVLVQSLVLYAESLELTIEEHDGARMRRFFKYLKFFRLLAEVSSSSKWEEGTPSAVRMKIDGPASILDGGAKYGLQLASFLPALFQLSRWKFACALKLNGKELKLSLDDSSGLTYRFGRLGIYIPEEVRMFARLFAERVPEWTLSSDSPFLKAGPRQSFVFPDITFTHGEKKVYLELFHKWHSRQIPERLAFLENHPDLPLVLGIERRILSSNPTLAERIESHPLFGSRIFLFRDFPPVEKMRKILEAFA